MLLTSADLLNVVDWSRAQFAMTAIYHWLFVPLTLGLGPLCAIMETIYVRTGDESWKRMTKFWMRLFGINFAAGMPCGTRYCTQSKNNLRSFFCGGGRPQTATLLA